MFIKNLYLLYNEYMYMMDLNFFIVIFLFFIFGCNIFDSMIKVLKGF